MAGVRSCVARAQHVLWALCLATRGQTRIVIKMKDLSKLGANGPQVRISGLTYRPVYVPSLSGAMPELSKRSAPPPPNGVERRQFVRQVGEKVNLFTARLKTNAAWMKRFLHRAK